MPKHTQNGYTHGKISELTCFGGLQHSRKLQATLRKIDPNLYMPTAAKLLREGTRAAHRRGRRHLRAAVLPSCRALRLGGGTVRGKVALCIDAVLKDIGAAGASTVDVVIVPRIVAQIIAQPWPHDQRLETSSSAQQKHCTGLQK